MFSSFHQSSQFVESVTSDGDPIKPGDLFVKFAMTFKALGSRMQAI